MVKKLSPCYGCKRRKPGCHDICKKYADFKTMTDKIKAARFLEKMETYGRKTTKTPAFRNKIEK